jgi:hypothetical protein
MTDIKAWFKDNIVVSDMLSVSTGEFLGEGEYRVVHRCLFDDDLVIKFELAGKRFCNVNEWDIYDELEKTPLGRWLAPCVAISTGGKILIQSYCADIPKEQLPKRVPACFVDLKPANWGLFKGRPVCRDYANNNITWMGGAAGTKLTKAKWRI